MVEVNRGKAAEDLACSYLLENGLTLLHRNYRSKRGEIDLVLQDAGSLVFVEVRYRGQDSFGSAAESVDRRKQTRLAACARQYLQVHPQATRQPCRFDVIAMDGPDNTIQWIRNAFDVID